MPEATETPAPGTFSDVGRTPARLQGSRGSCDRHPAKREPPFPHVITGNAYCPPSSPTQPLESEEITEAVMVTDLPNVMEPVRTEAPRPRLPEECPAATLPSGKSRRVPAVQALGLSSGALMVPHGNPPAASPRASCPREEVGGRPERQGESGAGVGPARVPWPKA